MGIVIVIEIVMFSVARDPVFFGVHKKENNYMDVS